MLIYKNQRNASFPIVEYNSYSGNDFFEGVKKRFLSEGESMMFERYCHDCENMEKNVTKSREKSHTNNTEQLKTDPQRKLKY